MIEKKIIIPILDFSRSGGLRVLTKLANLWLEKGYDVELVTYYRSSDPYFPINVPIIFIDNNGEKCDQSKNTKGNKIWTILISLFKYLRKNTHDTDIVLANFNLTVWPIFFAGVKKRFYYIQAYEPEFYNKKGFKQIFGAFLAWCSYFLPFVRIVNANIYSKYKNLNAINVIPPGLDFDIFYPKEICIKNRNVLVVGCIRREEPWKGFEHVGYAIELLHKRGYANKIKLMVAFYPVSYRNHILVQPHGDENLAEFYSNLDVLVAPRTLQIGAVHYPVIEAMSCHIPVI